MPNQAKVIFFISLFAMCVAAGWGLSRLFAPDSPPAESLPAPEKTVTYNKEIAPIIFQHCAPCHRPGQSAPFSLLTYGEVRKRAKEIVEVTQSRFMPPWLPEPNEVRFAQERRLKDEELELIQLWVAGGLSEGQPEDLPPLPAWAEGWQLGEPDLIVRMPAPYTLPAEGKDIYRNFVIPSPVAEARHVSGVEIQPGNPQIVHHAVLQVDPTPASRQLDEQEAGPGFRGMALGRAQLPDGHFIGWTPGKMPNRIVPGMSWQLNPGMDLVLQLHLRPSGKPETIQSTIGFYFAEKPPSLRPFALVLRSKQIDIPAGEADYRVEKSYELPVDVDVLSVYPHAHYLGKEMRVGATLPGGREKQLLHIADWDFNWQDDYRYALPVFLPKGSLISMRYQFDNSTGNPRNPHRPPQRVTYGQNSTDEMAELLLQVLPVNPNDLETLQRHAAYLAIQEEIQMDLARLEESPPHPALHQRLARHFQRLGQLGEAVAHLRSALQLEPDAARSHYRLADALAEAGDFDGALRHFHEADRLEPNQSDYLSALSQVYSRHPNPSARDPQRAVLLARRAAELTQNRDPAVLESLAIAYASAGNAGDSIAAAEQAIRAAQSAGAEEQAAGMQRRLEAYKQRFSPTEPGSTNRP